MKRVLLCTVILMVLVASGCDYLSGQETNTNSKNTNAQPSPQQVEKNQIDFGDAKREVQAAETLLKTPGKATVKDLKAKINSASQKLGKSEDDVAERCADCSDDTKTKAVEVWKVLTTKRNSLLNESQAISALEANDRDTLQRELNAEANILEDLKTAPPKSLETPASSTPAVQRENAETESTDDWDLWGILRMALYVVAGLLALLLLATGLTYLWKRSWMTIETNVGQVLKAHIAATREAQPDYAPKLSSLSSTQAEMSSRLSTLETEVRSLARLVRESLAVRRSDHNPSYAGGFNYQSSFEPVAQKDEPEFPVSAVDYLGKMDRFANVVRPDFQNGILVNAPDGDGELVLIRDSRDETQPLFVVPRATQFQTKQDFYTYYQKYYDCVRPSAGDVWIIGPAVVEKVTGGWQLREKGMLEVR